MKFQEVTGILKWMGGWYKYQARRVLKHLKTREIRAQLRIVQ